MKSRRVTLTLIALITLMIIMVIGFTGLLNISSFKQNYTESRISSYVVAGKGVVRKIEYAVTYGKSLDNFYRMDDLLGDFLDKVPEIREVKVVDPEGAVLYEEGGAEQADQLQDGRLNEEIIKNASFESSSEKDFKYVLNKGNYYVFIPISSQDENWIGSICLVFEEDVIKSFTDVYTGKLIKYLLPTGFIAAALLALILLKVSIISSEGKLLKKRLIAVILLVMSIAQITYGVINYKMLREAYFEVARENVSFTANIVKDDIESVVEKGIPYDKLYYIDDYFNQITSSVPEVASINMTDTFSQESESIFTEKLTEDNEGEARTVQVATSEEYINSKLTNIILDIGTVLLTAFLFMVEITFLLILIFGRWLDPGESSEPSKSFSNNKSFNSGVIRFLAFALFSAYFLPLSFIPIYMKNVYEPFFGLPKNMVLGLPITVEMFFAALATISAGYVIDKKGWKFVLYVGIMLLGIGSFLAGSAVGPLYFIVARSVTGIGFGFCLISLRSFIMHFSNSKDEQTTGMSSLFAGLYAGMNCGVITGAMLADRIGFSNVFFTALVLIAAVTLFNVIFLKFEPATTLTSAHFKQLNNRIGILDFITDRSVLLFFICIVLPSAVGGMFLDYYFPLYAESIGISSSNVGRAFLINGLCIVYIGPILSRFLENRLQTYISVGLVMVVTILALITFSVWTTLLMAFIAIVLLGISDSFAVVVLNNYYLNLQAVRNFGVSKALGYFDNMRKGGQMLGPLIFGSVLTFGANGIALIGLSFLGLLILFLFHAKTAEYRRGVGM